MQFYPVIYSGSGQRAATPQDIEAARSIMRDVALVLLRKTGRSIEVVEPVIFNGPAVDVSTRLFDTRTQYYPIYNALQFAYDDPIESRITVVFLIGNVNDNSGLGQTCRGVGYIDPNMGGLCVVGESVLDYGKKWRFSAPDINGRMEYGAGSVCLTLHEIGHTLGLQHPTTPLGLRDPQTLMSYRMIDFALGFSITNPGLFYEDEIAILKNHSAFKNVSWSAGEHVRLVPDKDVTDVIAGKIDPGISLILGRFNRDYEMEMGG